MKLLLIGDMHVRKDNLEESERLIDWFTVLKMEHNATPVFMGDQHDTMGIVRTEIINFWDSAYRKMGVNKSFSLEGNHDLCSAAMTSAMTAHNELTNVITGKTFFSFSEKVKAIGYIRNNEDFIKKSLEAYKAGARYILCHAEFDGAQYENGFYAPHGINLSSLPKDLTFISGHIHKKQQIIDPETKRVIVNYIGTPRMLTRSDIGEIKGVTIMNTDKDSFDFIQTPAKVAEPFEFFELKENEKIPEIKNSSKVFIDIIGDSNFVKKTLKDIPSLVKARSIIKDNKKEIEIKESDGIALAFHKYATLALKEKASKDEVDFILKGIYEKCPILKGV